MSGGNRVDLEALGKGKNWNLHIENETPEDAAARRAEAAEKAKHGRRLQFLCFMLAIVVVLFAFLWCGYVLATGSPDDKKVGSVVASAIVSSTVSGLVGFALGKR